MHARLPKYRLHKASGQALIELRGKRIYLGKYESEESHEKYHQLVADWHARSPSSVTPAAPEFNTRSAWSISELL